MAGDIAGAQSTLVSCRDFARMSPFRAIAIAQMESGDLSGMESTLSSLRDCASRAGLPNWNEHEARAEAYLGAAERILSLGRQ